MASASDLIPNGDAIAPEADMSIDASSVPVGRRSSTAIPSHKDKQLIRLKDAVGRKFSIPFNSAKTWQGMDELIQQAFDKVDVLGPHVKEGHFDLTGPNGEIILPSTWDELVEPGWSVTMTMWPLEKPAPVAKPAPHGQVRSRMPGMLPPPDIINVAPKKKNRKRTSKSGKDPRASRRNRVVYDWLATQETPGKKRRGTKRNSLSSSSSSSTSSVTTSSSVQSIWPLVFQKGLIELTRAPDEEIELPSRLDSVEVSSQVETSLEILNFSSARMSLEGPRASTPIVVVELVKQRSADSDLPSNTWWHATKSVMDFREFQNIALSHFPIDNGVRHTVGQLLKSIELNAMDEKWGIKPGTVLRCDLNSSRMPDASAVFVSVPSVYPNSAKLAFPPEMEHGRCYERKLYEGLSTLNSIAAHDNDQQFLKNQGARSNQLLWVRQTWLLIAGSGILTFSTLPRTLLEGKSIVVSDMAEPGDTEENLQFIDKDLKLYSIPLSKCRSFYELQLAVRSELVRYGTMDSGDEEDRIQFTLPSGSPLDLKDWAQFIGNSSRPTLKIQSAYWSPYYLFAASDADDGGSFPSSDDGSEIEAKALKKPDFNTVFKPSTGFMVGHGAPQSKAPKPMASPLNTKVAPFLCWASPPDVSDDISKDFEARMAVVESNLKHGNNDPYFDPDISLYFEFFDITVYNDMTEISAVDLHTKLSLLKRNPACDSRTVSIAVDYFEQVNLILEAFMPKDCQAPLATKCRGAFAMVIDILQRDVETSSSSTELSVMDNHAGWVVSRSELSKHELPSKKGTANKCPSCYKGVVYRSKEAASSHVRSWHAITSLTEDGLQTCLLPLSVAARARVREDQQEMLRLGRTRMSLVLKHLLNIQQCVIGIEDNFRDPARGIPNALLRTLKLVVAFACGLPHVLNDISDHYIKKVSRSRPKSLAGSKIRAERSMMEKLVENAMANAFNAHQKFSTYSGDAERDWKQPPLLAIGLPTVASQIVVNLVKMPVHNHESLAALYGTYAEETFGHALFLDQDEGKGRILALCIELLLVEKFYDWLKEMLSSWRLVIHPDSKFKTDLGYDVAEDDIVKREMETIEKQVESLDWSVPMARRAVKWMNETSQHRSDRGISAGMLSTTTLALVALVIAVISTLIMGFWSIS